MERPSSMWIDILSIWHPHSVERTYHLHMTRRSQLDSAKIAFVQAQRVAHLATADGEGNPHVVPVAHAFDGTHSLPWTEAEAGE